MSDNQIKNLIGDIIPELATFGPTGINRPDQTERMKSAVKDMVIDAGVSSVFFGIRPAYYGLRNFIGEKGFRMFKPRAGSGVATGTDILSAEQRLYGSGKFSNFNKVDPETEKFVAATLGPRAEDITMHIPVIGKAVTRLMRSPVFNF